MSPQVNLSGNDFDTLLAAYTGAAMYALTPVASNDNCTTGGSPGASCIIFNVKPGMVYNLQVDGANGAKGNMVIAVTFSPINDLWSGALSTFPVTGTTLGATLEAGEPGSVAGKNISWSVWYQYAAASNGVVKVCNRPPPTPASFQAP